MKQEGKAHTGVAMDADIQELEIKAKLIKKFHTLCGKFPDKKEAKAGMLASYNCSSTKEMSVLQLTAACVALQKAFKPEPSEKDKSRKRLLAAIGGWYKAIGMVEAGNNLAYIKATACQAAKAKSFNAIPLGKLRALYGEYCTKQEMRTEVGKIQREEVERLAIMN